jgi:hypothetical protein
MKSAEGTGSSRRLDRAPPSHGAISGKEGRATYSIGTLRQEQVRVLPAVEGLQELLDRLRNSYLLLPTVEEANCQLIVNDMHAAGARYLTLNVSHDGI